MYEPASATLAYAVPPRALYELRPLTTGEILDRTFTLYRRNFWLYCGLSATAAALQTVMSILQLFVLNGLAKPAAGAQTAQAIAASLIGSLALIVAALVYLAGYSVTLAATTSAVLSTYLGHATSIAKAFQAIRGRWFRYVCISLWWGWSSVWIFTLLFIPAIILIVLGRSRGLGMAFIGGALIFVAFLSMIYGVIAYIRNSLAIPASVMEGLKIRAAMRRSKTLAVGTKGRIFLLFLLLFALAIAAGILQAPFQVVIAMNPKTQHYALQGLSLILAFVTTSLIGPIGAIGFCLFYIDQRVRLEGFDIEAMMDPGIGSTTPKPAALEPVPGGFAPSGFTASPTPFPPSEFTAPPPPAVAASPFAPSGFTVEPEFKPKEADRV